MGGDLTRLTRGAQGHRSLLVGLLVSVGVAGVEAQPRPEHNLRYSTPAMVWDEAHPLGNGLLGALVWGDGHPLKISLDRTDLWDLRPVPQYESEDYSYERMRQWVREGRIEDLHRLYDEPYRNPGPTKIPAGRIEIDLEGPVFEEAVLDLSSAVARMRFDTGAETEVRVHASRPVALIGITTAGEVTPRLVVPPFAGDDEVPGARNEIVDGGDLRSLDYDAPRVSGGEDWTGFVQEGWGGFRFAVALAWSRRGDRWSGAWSVATSEEGPAPLDVALRRCRDALGETADLVASHEEWWAAFWSRSTVRVPNPVVERQWYRDTYKFGAAARPDTPPITLQGPWTADNGKIPPWKGDYHHDLNTELSYWPCYSGNRLEGGRGFLSWLWRTRDHARAWTRRFFDLPGLNVPMTADLLNRQIGGWHQYTHSATTAAWLAHHFWLHWRYSMDRKFLRERAYPFIREAAEFLEAVTEKGDDGTRRLPLSSSPEIHDNRLEAWFPEITNYDLALIRWILGTAAELAGELGAGADAARWREVLEEMPELALDPRDHRLLVAPGAPLQESHRHLSHLMAIHPLGLVRWEDGGRSQATIRSALAELDRLGTSSWTGYSFAWQATLAARARDGARAERALEIFSTAFCLRNSFHCNGDQSGQGHSQLTYRPFTLEGNFAAAAAVQEMLLQSYSGTLRVFPAVPSSWEDVSFETLRAEGAFLVSAQRRGGAVQRVTIVSVAGAPCRLENPFGSAGFVVQGLAEDRVGIEGDELRFATTPGLRVVLTRAPGAGTVEDEESDPPL
jgi:alpha-L-fucosidase 2